MSKITTYLTFQTHGDYYGVDTKDVVEIVKDLIVRPIPRSQFYVCGLAKFRDEFIVVLDLQLLLNSDKDVEKTSGDNIIIIDLEFNETKIWVGLKVDNIEDVINVNENSISEFSETNKASSEFIHGIFHDDERFIFLLENRQMIDASEVSYLLDLKSKSIDKKDKKSKLQDNTIATNTFLTFSLGDEVIAFPALQVKEVISEYKVTSIPLSDDYMEGVINLRGSIIPVLNIDKKFGLNQQSEKSCIAIIEVFLNGDLITVGAMMDEVRDVFEVQEKDVENSKSIETIFDKEYIKGVYHHKGSHIRIVNTNKLLSTHKITLD